MGEGEYGIILCFRRLLLLTCDFAKCLFVSSIFKWDRLTRKGFSRVTVLSWALKRLACVCISPDVLPDSHAKIYCN